MKSLPKLLFFISLFLGIFFRFYNTDLLSTWSDELASIYFSSYLSEAWSGETHPPVFYLLLRPLLLFTQDIAILRSFVALLGLFTIFYSLFLGRIVFGERGAILLGIFLFLSHVDVTHARMIRQYALFLDLTVLVLLLAQIHGYRLQKVIFGTLLAGIHPFGLIIPFGIAVDKFFHKVDRKEIFIEYVIPVIAISSYYLTKLVFLDATSLQAGYLSGGVKLYILPVDIIRALSGEHFPKVNAFEISWVSVAAIILLVTMIIFKVMKDLIVKKEMTPLVRQGFIIILLSLVMSEMVSAFYINVNVGRYFLFFMGILILSFITLFQKIKGITYYVFGYQVICLFLANPLQYYPGEREALQYYEKMKAIQPDVELVFCANKFQYFYYLKSLPENCMDQYQAAKEAKKDFVFVDLNGYGRDRVGEMSVTHEFSEFMNYGLPSSASAYFRE